MENFAKRRSRQDDDDTVGTSNEIVESKEVVSKPPCKYGSDCYRKNPEHFEKFSHPGKLSVKCSVYHVGVKPAHFR